MNDRYLFKAKRKDNGEWVEGHLITDEQNKDKCFIGYVFGTNDDGTPHDFDIVLVDPVTLCQCTGLRDKNSKLIWENDIVKTKFFGKEIGIAKNFNDYDEFQIAYYMGCYYFENKTRKFAFSYIADIEDLEIIGNIFDNPELLK